MEFVKIKREWLDSPEGARDIYCVLEDRGDRVLIACVNSDMPITPTQVVKKDMIYTIEYIE